MGKCPKLIEVEDIPFHPGGTALRFEIKSPSNRCKLRPPEHWNDESGNLTFRWIYSGGSPLVFGECDCLNYKTCKRLLKDEQS